jgi:hypothetical protein
MSITIITGFKINFSVANRSENFVCNTGILLKTWKNKAFEVLSEKLSIGKCNIQLEPLCSR